jgi:FlaA1/EpsC-like NDP-sugar epimerase
MPKTSIKQLLLNLPRLIKRGLMISGDLLLSVSSVWLAFGLRLDQWGFFQGQQWLVLGTAVGLSFPLFFSFGLYQAIFRHIGTTAFVSITRVFLIYTFLFCSIFTLYGINDVPRSIGVIQPMLLFIGIGASRYFVRNWLGGVDNFKKSSGHTQSNALIYGAGLAGRQLASALDISKDMLVQGFIDDDFQLHFSTMNGIPVYPNNNLEELIHRLDITDVLLAIPSAKQDRRSEIIASLSKCGVRVKTLPEITDLASGRVRLSDIHDLDMNDLLGRLVVTPDRTLLEKNIRNQVVLVTGAGGSIGSELCRQIIKFSPKSLILIDNSEHSLYLIYEELKNILACSEDRPLASCGDNSISSISHLKFPLTIVPCLASVRDSGLLLNIFRSYQPNTVFHAAAYKHVPLVEKNPIEGIRNNVFGTLTCAKASLDCGVVNFILVSTDKAVRPTNVMGASKRIAEIVLQAMSEVSIKENHKTIFSMVRFGNVLGSSGSVTRLFSAQIAAGGPITLTHNEITRYFMTIPEAAQLVIQASAMANGGDVFVLDMGEPVRIKDLAIKMIYLSGLMLKNELHPNGDIEIKITGLRKGEKLFEELLIGDNPRSTIHPKIMKAHEKFLSWNLLQKELENLIRALDKSDEKLANEILKNLVPEYNLNCTGVD